MMRDVASLLIWSGVAACALAAACIVLYVVLVLVGREESDYAALTANLLLLATVVLCTAGRAMLL